MPEGPEVKLISDHLQQFVGKAISGTELNPLSRYKGARANQAGTATIKNGDVISKIECKGKQIFWEIGGKFYQNRMGMTGYWSRIKGKAPAANVLGLEIEGGGWIYFNDERHFGDFIPMSVIDKKKKIASLGFDLLNDRDYVSLDQFLDRWEKLNGTWQLAEVLMDQEVIVCGVGNYLKCEVCYNIGIDPRTTVYQFSKSPELIKELFENIKETMEYSYRANGNSFKNFETLGGEKGEFKNYLKVYRQSKDPSGNKVTKHVTRDKRTSWISEAAQTWIKP